MLVGTAAADYSPKKRQCCCIRCSGGGLCHTCVGRLVRCGILDEPLPVMVLFELICWVGKRRHTRHGSQGFWCVIRYRRGPAIDVGRGSCTFPPRVHTTHTPKICCKANCDPKLGGNRGQQQWWQGGVHGTILVNLPRVQLHRDLANHSPCLAILFLASSILPSLAFSCCSMASAVSATSCAS